MSVYSTVTLTTREACEKLSGFIEEIGLFGFVAKIIEASSSSEDLSEIKLAALALIPDRMKVELLDSLSDELHHGSLQNFQIVDRRSWE
jgi:hypothetical protein